MRIAQLTKLTSVRVAAAFVVILGAGMGAGRLLLQYEQSLGFREEADRIAEALQLRPGMIVADVRAGSGVWTVDIAKRIGETGHAYATVGPSSPASDIFANLAQAGVNNVNVIGRTPGDSRRLPPECCDAILLRAVYHHFNNRPAIASGLFTNARPGARLVVIDFEEGTSEQLSGHGLPRATLVAEMTTVGFRVEETIEDWSGSAYCVIFTKPHSAS